MTVRACCGYERTYDGLRVERHGTSVCRDGTTCRDDNTYGRVRSGTVDATMDGSKQAPALKFGAMSSKTGYVGNLMALLFSFASF